MEQYRETIWGIDRKDRQWFQLLTLLGGIAGSVVLIKLELTHGIAGSTPNEVVRNVFLGISASFVASGFVAWGTLQLKELIMAIADWLKDFNQKNRDKWRQEGHQEGHQEGRQEGYEMGYEDASEGKPKQPPDRTHSKGNGS